MVKAVIFDIDGTLIDSVDAHAASWSEAFRRFGFSVHKSAVRWRSESGSEVRKAIRHLFLFIGAEPNTAWLSGSEVTLDEKGFVLTGGEAASVRRDPSPGLTYAVAQRTRKSAL